MKGLRIFKTLYIILIVFEYEDHFMNRKRIRILLDPLSYHKNMHEVFHISPQYLLKNIQLEMYQMPHSNQNQDTLS